LTGGNTYRALAGLDAGGRIDINLRLASARVLDQRLVLLDYTVDKTPASLT
jgi:hypothetical protein